MSIAPTPGARPHTELGASELGMRSVLIVNGVRAEWKPMSCYARAIQDRLGIARCTAYRMARLACDVLGFDPPRAT